MVRYYVQKGKIKYLLPPGRKQGFYLEKDVNNLSNELDAFLSMEEEAEEKVTLAIAAEGDLIEIAKIANDIFSSGGSSNVIIVPSWRYMVFEKNKEAQYVLKQDNTIIGFATILPFKPDTDKIEKLLRSETVSQAAITDNDIAVFEAGQHVRLYIGAIAINPRLDRYKRKKDGAILIRELISKFVELGKKGIIIDDITAIGATHIGVRILSTFGFHEIPARQHGNRAFIMNINESGSPISMQYKQALNEFNEGISI
jgi:hypothetical protein